MSSIKLYKVMLKPFPDILNVIQLSQILNVSVKTTYKILQENKIDSIRIGRAYKIPKVNVIQYLLKLEK